MKSLVSIVALCCAVGYSNVTWAQDSDTTSSTAAARSEKSHIKPVAERQLGKRARPTVKQKQEKTASQKREVRLSLQIPANLKKILLAKIDKRIARNVAKTKKLRLQAMALLDKFIKESPEDSPEMPEALLRMGELEWEDSRDQFIKDFEAWEKTPADRRGEPPNPSYAKPRARFLLVLKKHKTFDQYDLALYVDGFLANEEGKFKESLGRFNKILAWFPNSRFVADAHMVRAEYEFTKDFPDYDNAYKEYEEVLRHKDSELYDIALFKSAWCLWRLNRTEEAAKRFLAVFKSTEAGSKNADNRKRQEIDELQAEALKNLVAVFVEDEKNRADDMYKFLVKAGGEKFAGRIVKALAEKLFEQANYDRGIEAYRLLLKLEPMNPNAYKYALAIAQGDSTMEEWARLKEDYKWIIKDYVAARRESENEAERMGECPEPGDARCVQQGHREPAA